MGPNIREAHPELLFRGLAGGPMTYNKQTRDGFAERMTILQIFQPEAKTLIAAAFLAHGGYEAARDDVVSTAAETLTYPEVADPTEYRRLHGEIALKEVLERALKEAKNARGAMTLLGMPEERYAAFRKWLQRLGIKVRELQ